VPESSSAGTRAEEESTRLPATNSLAKEGMKKPGLKDHGKSRREKRPRLKVLGPKATQEIQARCTKSRKKKTRDESDCGGKQSVFGSKASALTNRTVMCSGNRKKNLVGGRGLMRHEQGE